MAVYLQAVSRVKAALTAGLSSPDQSSEQVALRVLQDAFPDAKLQMQQQAQQPGGVNLLVGTFTEVDRTTLDDSLRQFAVYLAQQAAAHGQTFMQFSLVPGGGSPAAIARFLDTAYWMSSAVVKPPSTDGGAPPPNVRVVDIASYCKLIEDLLELGTIQDNTGVFMHIEQSIVELMSKEVGTTSPARLCMLRSCNNLLRRLSKSQDLQLCGRILVFIARIYPLGDKSGVNLQGTVNSGLTLPIDEVAPGDVDSSGEPIDAKLYTTFWGLQNIFKNPQSILQQSVWSKTVQDMTTVLNEMDRRKVTVKAGHSFGPLLSGDHSEEGGPNAPSNMSVKYLSSSKLFGLQLRDASFRRQFLVQCATLLHCTQKPGKLAEKVNSSSSTFDGVQELSNKVYASMARTEESGADFANAVRHVLSQEDEWVDWKSSGCPPFDRPPAPSLPQDLHTTLAASLMGNVLGTEGLERIAAGKGRQPAQHAQHAQQQQQQQQQQGPAKRRRVGGVASSGVRLGGPALSLLRHITVPEDQMAGLAAHERKLLPTLQEFVQPVLEGMDPEAGIDEEYREVYTNKVYAWKVVRMLGRSHLSQLSAFKGGTADVGKSIEEAMLAIYPDKKERFEQYTKQRQEELKEQMERQQREEAEEQAAAAAAGKEGAEGQPAQQQGKGEQPQQQQQPSGNEEGQGATGAADGGVPPQGDADGGAAGGEGGGGGMEGVEGHGGQ